MNLDLCQQYLSCRSSNRIMMPLYARDKQCYGFTGNDKNNSNFHTVYILLKTINKELINLMVS